LKGRVRGVNQKVRVVACAAYSRSYDRWCGDSFGDVKISGSVNTNEVVTCSGTNCPLLPIPTPTALAFSQSKTKSGWTLGGGVEGAFAGNWTWKVEYLYVDLGSESGSVPDNFGGTFSWNTRFTDNIVRVGLNYQFH
jgi:outer membrane immunogenic protein